MSDKLRECPICGNTDLLYSIVDYNTKHGHTGCRACGISVIALTIEGSEEKWNTRYLPSDETVEAKMIKDTKEVSIKDIPKEDIVFAYGLGN